MATNLGTRLKRARLQQGLSQGQVAEKLDVSQATVSNWEQGKSAPDERELKKLERVLGKLEERNRHRQGGSQSDSDDVVVGGDTRFFGDWLRKSRESAGLSAVELADSSGISLVQIYNLEAGRSTNPREDTRKRLEAALRAKVPRDVQEQVAEEQSIEGLGPLTDFDPHDDEDLPSCSGVYVFYDVSDRPVYVGKAKNIGTRVEGHHEKFWFKYPIVSHAAYVEIKDERLRHQVEQVLIKFLKSNAVINKQSVDRD